MKPAARQGDAHSCPLSSGAVARGLTTVLIGGQPAARMGDPLDCKGPDIITSGSLSVLIGGQPAARMGDRTTYHGKVTSGLPTLLIGDHGQGLPPRRDTDEDEERPELVDVNIQLFNDRLGDPMASLTYTLELPDGSTRQGTTDGEGWVRQAQVPRGTYRILLGDDKYAIVYKEQETNFERAEPYDGDHLPER